MTAVQHIVLLKLRSSCNVSALFGALAGLQALIPGCEVTLVPGAGHAATCGSRLDLAAVLRARFPELRRPGLRCSMKQHQKRAECTRR